MTDQTKYIEGTGFGIGAASLVPRSAKLARKSARPNLKVVHSELTKKQRRLRVRGKADLAHLIDRLVAKRIRSYHLDRGLTQQTLTDEVGFVSQQIHKYESGIRRISAGRLLQIAEALNLSVHAFSISTMRRSEATAALERSSTLRPTMHSWPDNRHRLESIWPSTSFIKALTRKSSIY